MLNRVELEKIISDDLKYICIRKPNIEALKQILLLERKMPKSMSGEILTTCFDM